MVIVFIVKDKVKLNGYERDENGNFYSVKVKQVAESGDLPIWFILLLGLFLMIL